MKHAVKSSLKSMGLYPQVRRLKSLLEQYRLENSRERRKMVRFYASFVKPGDLCFDIGANLGNRTSIFLQLGARVIAVEPQAGCLDRLRHQYGANPAVTLVPQAVGAQEGQAELSICEEAPTISTMSDRWKNESIFTGEYQWTKTQTVAMTTLDALIAQYGVPVFCKIDVEGFEESVLRGLSQPIPYLSFEFTRRFFDDAQRCISHLRTLGPATFNCSLSESAELLRPTWVSAEELYAALEEVPGASLWGDIYVRFP